MVIRPNGPGGRARLPEIAADLRAALLTKARARVRGSAAACSPIIGILPTSSSSLSLTFRTSSLSVPRTALIVLSQGGLRPFSRDNYGYYRMAKCHGRVPLDVENRSAPSG